MAIILIIIEFIIICIIPSNNCFNIESLSDFKDKLKFKLKELENNKDIRNISNKDIFQNL